MQKNELQFWEELYVAAVLETDPAKVAARIDQAQGALRERWQILCRTQDLSVIQFSIGAAVECGIHKFMT